jgi:prephenate dehydratase
MTAETEQTRPRPRAGFLGPAGTFSEEALLASVAPGSVEPVGLGGIYETVAALRRGEVELALVPIENSLEGSINVTLDLLAGDEGDVLIVGEALLRVRHCLIASAPIELKKIVEVVSHPQVPGQCTRLLRGELSRAAVRAASSTAEAVRAVIAAGDPRTAALGTALAGEIYGGTILCEGVEDREDNETRFAWLARAADAQRVPPLRTERLGEWRSLIVFWGAGAEQAGWLVRCLQELSSRSINLTKIESRPQRRGLGSYVFFAEVQGAEHEPAIAEALASLRSLCEHVRVLGSYRSATPATAAI